MCMLECVDVVLGLVFDSAAEQAGKVHVLMLISSKHQAEGVVAGLLAAMTPDD